jgi:hypothetical protein
MPDENTAGTNAPVAEKSHKSIVPSKYGNKYRNGGEDELAKFINAQCVNKEGHFEYTAFFQLCRTNGIAEDKVAHYEGQVTAKQHGAEGRARMTLRNMLAPKARKEGTLIGLDGTATAVNLPKPALTGAAAAAKAEADAKPAEAATEPNEAPAADSATGEVGTAETTE